MRRLYLIPLIVLVLIGALIGGLYLYQQSRRPAAQQVVNPGEPPTIGTGTVGSIPAPSAEPLPAGTAPAADEGSADMAVGTPPALPSNIENLPAPAAANALLANIPASTRSAGINIALPLDNLRPRDIQDTYNQGRPGGRKHEATDILAPMNTPVHAVTDGVIQKLFLSKPGGNTIYEFDPQGVYCYYYAHLDHYAPGLKQGQHVKQGDVIGYVGTTGDADAKTPHLHFAIFQLGPDKKWWQGTPINPYPYLLQALARQQ